MYKIGVEKKKAEGDWGDWRDFGRELGREGEKAKLRWVYRHFNVTIGATSTNVKMVC